MIDLPIELVENPVGHVFSRQQAECPVDEVVEIDGGARALFGLVAAEDRRRKAQQRRGGFNDFDAAQLLVERGEGLLRFHEAIMERRRPLLGRLRHQPHSRLPGLRHERSLQRGMLSLGVVRLGYGQKASRCLAV